MDVALYLTILLGATVLAAKLARHKSLSPFLPRRYNFGKRRNSIRQVLKLLEDRQAKVLVETGTARAGIGNSKGDGASTIVFGKWAYENGAHLYSVDICPEAVRTSRRAVAEHGLNASVTLVTGDSVAFLGEFEHPVDFLFLDSYDYDRHDVAVQNASQTHHLAEVMAIEDRLHDGTVILIDDCDLPNGGKGKLVVERLVADGWIEFLSQYQVVMLRKPTRQKPAEA